MIKSILGSVFLLISAMFYSTRYICASIGVSNSDTWSVEEFNVLLENVPNNLLILSIISLLIGLVFIVWSILDRPK
ncbi:hypothetical protein J31TS2_21260 [Bacillus licheniformis]|nr:hypothetical protein J31TS2_21260 [Bacillus licheniformis]GIN29715.1 hypothetical protein J2TS5_17540 [Bacillus licheniformis]